MAQASPVRRDTVFILADGSFVVQWEEDRVQELLSGQYRSYETGDYGYSISDYELSQLQAVGRVERYDDQEVWLSNLPQHDRVAAAKSYAGAIRVRSYYLNTSLPPSRLPEVQDRIKGLGLGDMFLAAIRSGLVAVLRKNGTTFHELVDAERAHRLLTTKAPETFQRTAIAFVETGEQENQGVRPMPQVGPGDTIGLLGRRRGMSLVRGKRALILMSMPEERAAIGNLMAEMGMEVTLAETGVAGLHLLEDVNPDLLVMDVQLPDMHGWELLAKMKEIGTFQALPKIMIADHRSKSDDQVYALTVGKVDVYLIKPISMTQLRQNILLTLENMLD